MQAVSTARPKSSTSGLTPDWAAVTARKAAILRLGDLAFEIAGAFHLSRRCPCHHRSPDYSAMLIGSTFGVAGIASAQRSNRRRCPSTFDKRHMARRERWRCTTYEAALNPRRCRP